MDSFEVDVTRSQMYTTDIIKAGNVRSKCQQCDSSQIFTQRPFLYVQWENINVMLEYCFIYILLVLTLPHCWMWKICVLKLYYHHVALIYEFQRQ